jgi:hypothetical protein
MLKRLAEHDVRRAAAAGDGAAQAEEALRILYQRKAFREETGMDEDHYPEGRPPPPATAPQAAPAAARIRSSRQAQASITQPAIFPAAASTPARSRASPPSALTGGKPRDDRALPCRTSAAQVAGVPPDCEALAQPDA